MVTESREMNVRTSSHEEDLLRDVHQKTTSMLEKRWPAAMDFQDDRDCSRQSPVRLMTDDREAIRERVLLCLYGF